MIAPRLKTSKAWTDLPKDFKDQVSQLFKSHFKDQALLGEFEVLGRIYKNEVVLRCVFTYKNSIRPLQFDLSTDYSSGAESKALATFEKLVDCAASLFQSSFEDVSFGVPAIWTEVDFDGVLIFAKSEAINHKLEDEANKLLGEDFLAEEAELLKQEGLITGDLENDEIEAIADILNKKKTTH